jgi:hypothetical protein
VNAAVVLGYWLFLVLGNRSVFTYFFSPVNFYIWTLAHTAFSLRARDWKGLLGEEA